MKKLIVPTSTLSVFSSLLAFSIMGPAIAQDSRARPMVLEEVIVTAQKREENLQDIPISLVAFDPDQLSALGITNIGDITNKVPNLRTTAFPYSPTTIRLFMRGVGSNETQITQDPSVGVYLNGVYIARSAGLSMDLADLERMEILRGPQGTLYGRNATGGAINLVTGIPSGEFAVRQDVSLGGRDYWRSRTQLDLPALGNVKSKFAYLQSAIDGTVRNIGVGRDFGESEKKGLLFLLRWEPSENVTVDYSYDWSDLDFTSNYYQATDGVGPTSGDGFGSLAPILSFLGGPAGVEVPLERRRVGSALLKDPFKGGESEIDGHALTVTWDLDELTFKSITGYREVQENVYQDYSANPTFTFFQNDPVDLDQRQVSQELQALGELLNKRLSYVAGLYYFRESGSEFEIDRADVLFTNPPIFSDRIIITQRTTSAKNSAVALYGQAAYDISNDLTVTLGARYTRDRREAEKRDIFFPVDASDKQSFSQFNPSLIAEYRIDSQRKVYAKVVTGYKSGGYNLRAGSVSDFERGFEEEQLISYEAGLKSDWLSNRLQVNAAVFYSDYDDIQVDIPLLFNPSQTNTFNAGQADISGAELDIKALPTERLMIGLSYGYLDAKFKEVVDPQTGTDITDIYVLPNAPKYSYRFDVEYRFPDIDLGTLTAYLNYSWQDDVFTQGNARIAYGAFIESYGLLNGRLVLDDIRLGQRARLQLALWGRNLEDKDWVTDSIGSFRGFVADRLAAYGEPRTLGVDLTLHF